MFKAIFKILILFLLVSASALAGDTGTLNGVVTDSVTGEPIPGASVHLAGTKFGAMTDSDGSYQIKQIPAGCYCLQITTLSYETKEFCNLEINHEENASLNISLILKITDIGKAISFKAFDQQMINIRVFSPAFNDSEFIPPKYTCNGLEVSPPIEIYDASLLYKYNSIALICFSPDAPSGVKIHWVIFNLPARELTLPENIDNAIYPDLGKDFVDIRPVQGINDFCNIGYNGPCSPIGQEHRYIFKLYALDTVLKFEENEIQKGITKLMLERAMAWHIITYLVLEGRYKRE